MRTAKFIHSGFLCILLTIISYQLHAQEACKPRLIIGSGINVNVVYSTSRSITHCDITIDNRAADDDRFLNPTHIMDISDKKNIEFLSKKYNQTFAEIIFEHVGDGFATFVNSGEELSSMIALYHAMLAKEGVLIYEGYRGAVSYSDQHNKLNMGIPDIIESTLANIDTIETKAELFKTSQRFEYISNYYTSKLEEGNFKNISVMIKEDELYREVHPNEFPHYYLEVKAEK